MKTGKCYIVATPIGNLDDMTYRAVETLKSCNIIAAEDTRHSIPLLQHYQINTHCIAYHEHNEAKQAEVLLKRLNEGGNVALISDAGTPLISDPGYRLVTRLKEEGVEVIPVPGACALIAALSASGLNTEHFVFEGFLPSKQIARQKQITKFIEETRTVIFYESTHRINACLTDIVEVFGNDKKICLAKEITKSYETIITDTVEKVIEWMKADNKHSNGEFVLLLEGAEKTSEIPTEVLQLFEKLLKHMSRKDASKLVAEVFGVSKNQLYNM